jgi:hypothetical protein
VCSKPSPKGGHIVDATFVEFPRQHNTREKMNKSRVGQMPERFEKNPHVDLLAKQLKFLLFQSLDHWEKDRFIK